jgi:hypothetical protein
MNKKLTVEEKIELLKSALKQATPVDEWTGTSNIPFYAEIKKPARSLSKHDGERSTYWRCEDVDYALKAVKWVPDLIAKIEDLKLMIDKDGNK